MSILLYLIIGYFITLFGYQLILIILFLNLKKDKKSITVTPSSPFVSILVAVRDEEKCILSCLKSIASVSWPADKFEVLIGNDGSTDNTKKIVLDFIKNNPNFYLIDITKTIGKAKGKANVLAILAQEAKGAFFFFTDADIKVPQTWIQSMLANYNEKVGIISGVTITRGNTFFHYYQSIDWIYAFGMIKVASDYTIPITAVGNNMMISRKAYASTGGYENLPFSITEDLQLFLAVIEKGWKYKNLMSPDCLGSSTPIKSFSALLSQRRRWSKGVVQLPYSVLIFLFFQALFLFVISVTLIYYPIPGILLWVVKILLQQFLIVLSFRKIKEPYSFFKGVFVYEIYTGLFSILLIAANCIPKKIEWKGRVYLS